MSPLRRLFASIAFVIGLGMASGCTTTSLIATALEQTPAAKGMCLTVGCAATEVLAYAYGKATEGDPTPCFKLNSVARALSGRCGEFERGSLVTKDVAASGLPVCPLTAAARDPKLWPVLPELLEKGAQLERCVESPMAVLARTQPCPDFASASAESLQSLRYLAEADDRAIRHDVVRMLSCPKAIDRGLDRVVAAWIANGQLPTSGLAFSALSALDPMALGSSLSQALEAQGHEARLAFGGYDGRLAPGFDEALRRADLRALDWWLLRVPELANRVPAAQGGQMAWLPLARVLTPVYLEDASRQEAVVAFLLARGADPMRTLPHDGGTTVLAHARKLKSPALSLLDAPTTTLAGSGGEPVARNYSSSR